MTGSGYEIPDWERLLAAERHLQHLVPGTVLVGGTAAPLHARHRISMDADHVLRDLRERFDDVLSKLENAAGLQTDRVQKPVLILGQLDGILTGIRQLRRTCPLETEEVEGLRVPRVAEMARIKAWRLATRHTVRDYLDTVVLFERLGEVGTAAAMESFDTLYSQPGGTSPLAEVVERLGAAAPKEPSGTRVTRQARRAASAATGTPALTAPTMPHMGRLTPFGAPAAADHVVRVVAWRSECLTAYRTGEIATGRRVEAHER